MAFEKIATKIAHTLTYNLIVGVSIAYFAPAALTSYTALNILGLNAWIGSFGLGIYTNLIRYTAQSIFLEQLLPFLASYLDKLFNIQKEAISFKNATNIAVEAYSFSKVGPLNYAAKTVASLPGDYISCLFKIKPENKPVSTELVREVMVDLHDKIQQKI